MFCLANHQPPAPQEIVDRCDKSDEEVDSVFDIMSLEDDTRDKLLQLEPAKMAGVAKYVCCKRALSCLFYV